MSFCVAAIPHPAHGLKIAMTQSGGTHMYYGKDGYWKKVQEYLPEENRLTEACLPDEYFVGIGRFGIHRDHYRVKEPKTRIRLFHGVGEGM